MDFSKYFEEPAPDVPVGFPDIDPAIGGALAMRLLLNPDAANEFIITTQENPTAQELAAALGGEYDQMSLLAGMALAFQLLHEQNASKTAQNIEANTEYVDGAIQVAQKVPAIARLSADSVLLARDSALNVLNMSPAQVLQAAMDLDRSPDDPMALALQAGAKPLYTQYQEFLRLYTKDRRTQAVEQLRDLVGVRLFRLAFFQAHCPPGAPDIQAARMHPEYDGTESLLFRIVTSRPSRR